MALTIETAEAADLAQSLAEITGESMSTAVTLALKERLMRERQRRAADAGYTARVAHLAAELRRNYDTTPVGVDEWSYAAGDPS